MDGFRRWRVAAASGGALAIVVATAVLVALDSGGKQSPVELGGPASTETTSPVTTKPDPSRVTTTTLPKSVEIGPHLDVDHLPPLPERGVGIAVGDFFVLVGLDGTVYGHLTNASFAGPTGSPGPLELGLLHRWVAVAPGPVTEIRYEQSLLAHGATVTNHTASTMPTASIDTSTTHVARGRLTAVSGRRDIVTLTEGKDGHTFAVDLTDRRRRDLPEGCEVADRAGPRWYLACGSDMRRSDPREPGESPRTIVGRPPGEPPTGHWEHAYLSPDHATLLAQWFGECDMPTAFVVPAAGGTPVPAAAPGSLALGWTADGRSVVQANRPACGDEGDPPGVYLCTKDGERTLVYGLEELDPDMFWGARLWQPLA